jgi:hypothetical protein
MAQTFESSTHATASTPSAFIATAGSRADAASGVASVKGGISQASAA